MNNINFVLTSIFFYLELVPLGNMNVSPFISQLPQFAVFHLYLFLRQLHWGGGQRGRKRRYRMIQQGKGGASSLLLMSPVKNLAPFLTPFLPFPGKEWEWSSLGLKISHVWNCPILSEPSLPSGSICSAQPPACWHPHQGDICGYSCLILGFS